MDQLILAYRVQKYILPDGGEFCTPFVLPGVLTPVETSASMKSNVENICLGMSLSLKLAC